MDSEVAWAWLYLQDHGQGTFLKQLPSDQALVQYLAPIFF